MRKEKEKEIRTPKENRRTEQDTMDPGTLPQNIPGPSHFGKDETEEEMELNIHPPRGYEEYVHTEEAPKKERRKEKRKASTSSSESESSDSSSDSSSEYDSPPRRSRKSKKKKHTKTKSMLKRYQEYCKELERENKKLTSKLDEKRSTIKKKENELTRARKRTEELEGKIRKLKEEVTETERQREKTQDENNRLREKLKKTETVKEEFKLQRMEAGRRCENTEKQLMESKKKIEECESLNKELIEKLTSTRTATQTKKASSRNSLKLLLIGDSNSQRIAPHLDRKNKWEHTEDTYKIEDLGRVKCDNQYDAVVILLGTNNIKRGQDGKKEAEKLTEQVERFNGARHRFIVEIPPINRKGCEVERRIFNTTLHNNNDEKKYKVIRMIKEVEEAPIEQALQDDLHLTRTNAKNLAIHIENVVERVVPPKTEDQDRDQKKERKQSTQEEDTDRWHRNIKTREEKKDIPCYFYKQDRCHRGSRCFYSHDLDSSDRSRRGRSTERRQSDHNREQNRSRSKSGDRRRVIFNEHRVIRPVANHE